MANKRSLILFCLLFVIFVLTAILSKNHQKLIFTLPNYEQDAEQAKKEWDEIESKFEEAKALLQNPQTAPQALEIFLALEKKLGENTHLIKFRLQAQIAIGQAQQAFKNTSELVKVYDHDPDFYRIHVISALLINNIQAADASLKFLYKLNSKDPYNYLLTAFILKADGQHTEASKYYSAAQQTYGMRFLPLINSPLLRKLHQRLFSKVEAQR